MKQKSLRQLANKEATEVIKSKVRKEVQINGNPIQ